MTRTCYNMEAVANSLLIAGFLVLGNSQKSIESDVVSNSVRIEFDFVGPSDWSIPVVTKFREVISTFATHFCVSDKDVCGVTGDKFFQPNAVKIKSISPLQQDTIVIVYVTMPNNESNNGDYVLKREDLQKIIISNKLSISKSLRGISQGDDPNSFRISRVDGQFILDLADQTLNKIIIPIVCIVFFIMVGIVVAFETNSANMNKDRLEECQQQATLRRNGKSPDVNLFQVQTGQNEVV